MNQPIAFITRTLMLILCLILFSAVLFINWANKDQGQTVLAQEASVESQLAFNHPSAIETLKILKHRCDECHGPDEEFPEGGFGPMEELHTWIDQGWIVPGNSKMSNFLTIIHPTKGTMPPRWADNGKLTDQEYATITNWVKDGAKLQADQTEATTPQTVKSDTDSAAPFTERLLLWLGKFHPAVVHFPIALLLVGFFVEFLYMIFKKEWMLGGVRVCLIFAVPGAIAASALGFMWHEFKPHTDTMDAHEWAGILTTLCAIITLILNESRVKYPEKSYWHWIVRVMLLLCAFFVSAAGYYGGMLSRGENFHQW